MTASFSIVRLKTWADPTGPHTSTCKTATNEWLQSLPPTMRVEPEILRCHGAPSDDLQYLLEEVAKAASRYHRGDLVAERLGPTRAALLLCGHSHIPRVVRHGARQIVNPGSVGLQAYDDVHPWTHHMETGSPHARYAILDREPAGGWRVSLIARDYDWRSAANDARRAGRRDWAHALETGYALRASVPPVKRES